MDISDLDFELEKIKRSLAPMPVVVVEELPEKGEWGFLYVCNNKVYLYDSDWEVVEEFKDTLLDRILKEVRNSTDESLKEKVDKILGEYTSDLFY